MSNDLKTYLICWQCKNYSSFSNIKIDSVFPYNGWRLQFSMLQDHHCCMIVQIYNGNTVIVDSHLDWYWSEIWLKEIYIILNIPNILKIPRISTTSRIMEILGFRRSWWFWRVESFGLYLLTSCPKIWLNIETSNFPVIVVPLSIIINPVTRSNFQVKE